jgi:hypothetical protein
MFEEIICGIYQIQNLIDHKRIIGQSIDIYRKWYGIGGYTDFLNQNKYFINNYLQNAWNKYGQENFKFDIIEILPNWKP